jgi:putative flippase GtrA
MKIIDIIFALICGWVVAFVASDFLKGYGVNLGIYGLLLHWILPIFFLVCLWLASLIGRKFLFVHQAAKFFLVGIFATIVDLFVFEVFTWVFVAISLAVSSLLPKSVSFLFATAAKYWGNKHWAFGKGEDKSVKKEVFQFIAVTLVGLLIDISFFYYFTKILGPQFAIPATLWIKLSVLASAVTSAVWSFCGYKFIVFKK